MVRIDENIRGPKQFLKVHTEEPNQNLERMQSESKHTEYVKWKIILDNFPKKFIQGTAWVTEIIFEIKLFQQVEPPNQVVKMHIFISDAMHINNLYYKKCIKKNLLL